MDGMDGSSTGKETRDMGPEQERRQDRCNLKKVIRLVMLALAVTAVVKELRTPPEERTWHGVVAGFVPYEFRVPTVERIKERVWDPEGEHLLNPHVFGVGWTLNVGKLVAVIKEKLDAAAAS